MKKTILVFSIFFTLIIRITYAQNVTEYKDLIIYNNCIWALTSNGYIEIFDVESGKHKDNSIPKVSKVLFFNKDKNNNVVIADKWNRIKRYNKEKKQWEIIARYDTDISGFVIDNKNQIFTITEKGIIDLSTNKLYFSDSSLNYQIHYKDKWGEQSCYLMDKHDNIWLGFGYGEFGGNIIVFNTNNKKFIHLSPVNIQIELYPIKSFFEDSSSVYFSGGVQHFLTSGEIVRIKNFKASLVFESESHRAEPSGSDNHQTMVMGEYIGPAGFNYYNNSIYFYSQNGVFCGNISKDLSIIEDWEKITEPKLKWRNGQKDAIGSPMNVFKIVIIDKNRFAFLTQDDGIGFYNGEKLIMLK